MYERGDQGETTCLSFGPKEIKSRELTLYSRCVNSVISGLQEHFLGIWQKRKSAGVRLEEDGWFNAVNAVCKWWKERMMAPPQKPSPCLPWFREVHPHHGHQLPDVKHFAPARHTRSSRCHLNDTIRYREMFWSTLQGMTCDPWRLTLPCGRESRGLLSPSRHQSYFGTWV